MLTLTPYVVCGILGLTKSKFLSIAIITNPTKGITIIPNITRSITKAITTGISGALSTKNMFTSPPATALPGTSSPDLHALAPRVVFIDGLPVPVPTPSHEVLDYLTGR